MSHSKKQTKDQKGNMNISVLDKAFQSSGLGTGAVASDTINFILNQRSETNKQKTQDAHMFQMNQLLKPSVSNNRAPEVNEEQSKPGTIKQFMANHGRQVIMKEKEKKWNTGTKDNMNLFTPKSNVDVEYEMSDYDLQKAINNNQRKLKTNKKSIKNILGNEIGANVEVAQAMREREKQEALELERMMMDDVVSDDIYNESTNFDQIDHDFASEVFEQEVRIVDEQRRADQLRKQNKFLELEQLEKLKQESELQKWKDTGYEEDIIRSYQNPLEKRAAAIQNKASQQIELFIASESQKTPKIQKIGKNFKETVQFIKENQKLESAKKYEKQQSLFQKSQPQTGQYLTLDGNIKFDKQFMNQTIKTPIEASYTSLQEKRMANNLLRNRVEQYKNKIISQSRFFILKQQQNQPISAQIEISYQKQATQLYRAGGQSSIQILQQQQDDAQFSRKKNMKSQNLSSFALQSQSIQSRIPDVKEWFENLEICDRVLAVSTIDAKITKEIKQMHQKLQKSSNGEFGKFRMLSSAPTISSSMIITNSSQSFKKDNEKIENNTKKPIHVMSLANTNSHRSSKEVEDCELQLLQFVRFTDTLEMHDTITVTDDLLRDSNKFYQLAENIVGTNYLKQPHEIKWLEEDDYPQFEFESSAPLWLDMHQPNSIAAWILYYIERALFIQYQTNVKGLFQNCKDSSKQPIFLNTDGKNIMIKDEIKPFWRNFCEDAKNDKNKIGELVDMIRSKALEEFKIQDKHDEKNIDAFNGGLSIHSGSTNEQGLGLLIDQIEVFLTDVEESAKNFVDVPSKINSNKKQLNLKEVCMNTLKESSSLSSPTNVEQIGKKFCFQAISRQSNVQALNDQEAAHVQMRLERILIDQFRFIVTSKLKSHFTTANRRLQKKKIKKLKQKEQEREKDRQLEEEKKREIQESKNEGIIINNVNAIELLIGSKQLSNILETKPEVVKTEEPVKPQVAKGGKKKRKGKKSSEQEEKIEEKKEEIPQIKNEQIIDNKLNEISITNLPIKSSTPKEQQKNLPQTSKKVDPQNYFQVFGHKYAASLESQGESNLDSDTSKTKPQSKDKDSRGGTIKTLSTNEESKKSKQNIKEKAEQAMSNQEIINLFQSSSVSSQGNSQINKKSWQRRAHGQGEMINELLSETSLPHDHIYQHDVQNIHPKMEGNYLLPELEDSGSVHSHISEVKIPSSGDSSHSSVKENNRILKITKNQNRKVIPRRNVQSSESEQSSIDDPDQDLLPDIYTTIRPEDNDSSDYGLEAGQGEDESIDDDSSVALSKNQNSQILKTPEKQNMSKSKRYRHQLINQFRSANSKKTIKSANHKIVDPNKRQIVMNKKAKINFYPKGGYEEEVELEEQPLIFESEKIINRWTQLKPNVPLTIVYISMSRELDIEGQFKKKQGKTKAQKKADWKKFQDVSEEVQPKIIEIIKPDESATKALRAAPVQLNLLKASSVITSQKGSSESKINTASNDKKAKKKNPINNPVQQQTNVPIQKINPLPTSSASAQAMNQFMMKMHGSQQQPENDKLDKKNDQVLSEKYQSKDIAQNKGELSNEKLTKLQSDYKKKEIPNKYSQVVKNRQVQAAPEYAKKPHHAQHKGDQQLTTERLSMMEEAKILKDGYHYQVKKSNAERKDSKPQKADKEEFKSEATNMLQNKSAPVKLDSNKVEKSGLSLESKEYFHQITKTKKTDDSKPVLSLQEAIEGQTESFVDTPPPEPKKKAKKKAARSNKTRKKHSQGSQQNQMQNMKFDPMTGQIMDFVMGQQAQGGFQGDAFADGQNNQQFGFNKQVQDFIYQLNQQVMVQQQAQLQEMQQREQEEAETQMQEECEPCEETNGIKYDQFFELLEEEMKNKVKEIDELKDSVRKERQGFISIIENIVKDTFSNRYGNGYVGIKTFGSMATELAIETSDVDLVVTGINSFQSSYNYGREYSGKNQLLRMMQKLYDNLCYLKDKGVIYKIKFIQGANVPIIKLVADLQMINRSQIEKAIERINQERSEENEETGAQNEERKRRSMDLSELGLEAKDIEPTMRYLQVDISIDEQSHQYLKYDNQIYGNTGRNHSGIDTIYHIQDLVKNRKDLRPIVMIMKKIFDGTFLSMPYYGGISSYSLVLMVSAYLKAYDADKEASISQNLSSFFHFYGSQFKPHIYYLNGDDIVFCEDPQQRPFQDPFIVLDPLDNSNNISHSTFRIKDIQKALVKAFKIINLSCEKYQQLSDSDMKRSENQKFQPKEVVERLITEIKQEYFSPSQYLDE